MARSDATALVVGGGFFGTYLALLLADRVKSVVVVEREADLLLRASYNNQARVHAGYHYPRSLMTAVRSRINFPVFLQDFADCICDDFESYYPIARVGSKVTAAQFRLFMERVGAGLKPAPERITRLFNPDWIEAVFAVREVAFDAAVLRRMMRDRLTARGIPVHFGTAVESVAGNGAGRLVATCRSATGVAEWPVDWVFNCTYSGINQLLHRSGLPLVPLKHELTELALVEPPAALDRIAITVMCGPFFSLMPFPDRRLWTLSHVRYTPHCAWHDTQPEQLRDGAAVLAAGRQASNAPFMIRDAARYLPALADCRYRDSLWEVKTLLPQSELDDGRPILFQRCPRLPQFVTILGGKLDNVYDLPQDLDELGLPR